MDPAELQPSLDAIFDQALVYHGFTDYMRDYEMIVFCTADPRTGITPQHERYLFKSCVHSAVDTAVTEATWRQSLDDRLIDYKTGVDLEGFVWGVKWQCLYPGARVVENSELANHWAAELGIPFHEVRVKTNGHNLNLVFSDLAISAVEPGYSPFVVGEDASAENPLEGS